MTLENRCFPQSFCIGRWLAGRVETYHALCPTNSSITFNFQFLIIDCNVQRKNGIASPFFSKRSLGTTHKSKLGILYNRDFLHPFEDFIRAFADSSKARRPHTHEISHLCHGVPKRRNFNFKTSTRRCS